MLILKKQGKMINRLVKPQIHFDFWILFSSKFVRNQLQDKLKADFTQRKKEIDKLTMEIVNSMNSSSDAASESEPEVKPKKRKADSSDESDYKPAKSAKKRRGSSDDSGDWKETKKKKPKGKYTGNNINYKHHEMFTATSFSRFHPPLQTISWSSQFDGR